MGTLISLFQGMFFSVMKEWRCWFNINNNNIIAYSAQIYIEIWSNVRYITYII